MTDLLALAAECEAATGPDRDLDARIHSTLGLGEAMEEPPGWPFPRIDRFAALPYTDSVDAALALFEQALPGWGHSLWRGDGNYYPGHNREVSVWCPAPFGCEPRGPYIHASAPTLPRAIVAAVLRGVAARGEG